MVECNGDPFGQHRKGKRIGSRYRSLILSEIRGRHGVIAVGGLDLVAASSSSSAMERLGMDFRLFDDVNLLERVDKSS